MVTTVIAVDRIRVDDPIGAIAGARHGRHLGHALLRPLRDPGAGRARTASARPACSTAAASHQLGVQALGIAAVAAFVFAASFAVVLRSARRRSACASQRAPGARGPRPARARHVGLPGAVPARLRRRPALRGRAAQAERRRRAAGPRPSRETDHEEDRGIHPPRGAGADPGRPVRDRAPEPDRVRRDGLRPPGRHRRALPRRHPRSSTCGRSCGSTPSSPTRTSSARCT